MTLFRLRQWANGSLWLVPAVFGLAGVGLALGLAEYDRSTPVNQTFDFSSGTATQLLAAIAGAAVAFTGFAFSVLLLVVQLASAQLSPRAMRVAYQGWLNKVSLGLWVGTLTYALVLLESVTGTFVPQVAVAVAGGLVFVSVVTFLLLIGRISRILRPGPMAERILAGGRRAIARLHPHALGEAPALPAQADIGTGEPWTVRHAGRGGVIQAVDVAGLVREAARADCVVVAARLVGDYAAPGTVLLRVHGGDAALAGRLRRGVTVGAERTLELDPMYAFRILADIAVRALSPAVNDPTTAVQVLKRIDELLQEVAGRELGRGLHRDAAGRARLVLQGPGWDDYVAVGLAESVRFGAGSPQVARSLRALMAGLIDAVPPERRPALEERIAVLDEAVAAEYPGPLARAEALRPDRQGFGPGPV